MLRNWFNVITETAGAHGDTVLLKLSLQMYMAVWQDLKLKF